MTSDNKKKYNNNRREKYKNDAEFRELEKIRKKLWYEENRERILNQLAEKRKLIGSKNRINQIDK